MKATLPTDEGDPLVTFLCGFLLGACVTALFVHWWVIR